MIEKVQTLSEEVAEEAVTSLALLGPIACIISIIYNTYQLWSLCYGNASEIQSDLVTCFNTDTNNYPPQLMNRATFRLRRVSRKRHQRWDDDKIQSLARLMLDKVRHSPENVEACCMALNSLPVDEEFLHDDDDGA